MWYFTWILGVMLAGCIVTKGIPDTLDLDDFMRTVWCHWPRARRLEAARSLARTLLAQARHAHRNGFFHHDLKWRNILVFEGEHVDKGEVLVDGELDSTKREVNRFGHG